MSSIRTLTAAPATTLSCVRRTPPVSASARNTSVDVPPISNPITRSNPAARAISHAPITPPARPRCPQPPPHNPPRRLHPLHRPTLIPPPHLRLQPQQISPHQRRQIS